MEIPVSNLKPGMKARPSPMVKFMEVKFVFQVGQDVSEEFGEDYRPWYVEYTNERSHTVRWDGTIEVED